MYNGKLIAVVIPAYNEEGFVGTVIETVPDFVDRIYPVDDYSTDETWSEIREATMRVNSAATLPDEQPVRRLADGGTEQRVVPIRHTENRGVGGAIKTGYKRALEDGADVVAVMNGDGQMDPDILSEILDPVVQGDADYAKGNRLVTKDHWDGMSPWRLFGNFTLTTLTRIASGYWGMTDPQNGYTAISADALEQVDLDELYDQYGFLNDLLVRLNTHEMRIADVEMTAVYGDENSSIRYSRFIPRLSWLLLRNFVWRLWKKYVLNGRAVVLPYLVGLVGSIVLLLSLLLSLQLSAVDIDPLSTVFGLFLCVILIGLGMMLDRKENVSLETTVRK